MLNWYFNFIDALSFPITWNSVLGTWELYVLVAWDVWPFDGPGTTLVLWT